MENSSISVISVYFRLFMHDSHIVTFGQACLTEHSTWLDREKASHIIGVRIHFLGGEACQKEHWFGHWKELGLNAYAIH